MAGTSSSRAANFLGMHGADQNLTDLLQQQHSSAQTNSSMLPPSGAAAQKRRRNQPGTPSPDAEVIALSPHTLMATHRFVCEKCHKGFQREQNLQLHRRGHNLPWRLKQKTTNVVKRKVYVCPEPTCVHHDPSRALGDLTGIKKHFSRKHGEKKYRCERCTKMYAVQSDWKAHCKTCGTREYRCECGTLFSRRDSFVTHKAFCDALNPENDEPSTMTEASRRIFDSSVMSSGLPPVGLHIPPPAATASPGSPSTGLQTPPIPPTGHQNPSSSQDVFPLGGYRPVAPLEGHVGPSAFRYAQPVPPPPPPPFLVPDSSQDYNHGFHPHRVFFGMVDIPDFTTNPTLSFRFHSDDDSNKVENNGHASGSRASAGTSLFPNMLMGKQIPFPPPSLPNSRGANPNAGGRPSLHGGNHPNARGSPHPLSALALLEKAARIGAGSNNTNADMLGGFDIFSPANRRRAGGFGGGNNQTAVGGGSGGGAGRGGVAVGSSSIFLGGFDAFGDGSFVDQNAPPSVSGRSPAEKMTRDFLGIGGMAPSKTSGGFAVAGEPERKSAVPKPPLGLAFRDEKFL